MRKPEKEPKTEKAGAPVPSGRSGKEGDSGEKKPGRGRKPRAKKQQGETGAAVETGEVREAGTVTESETASEKAGETVTEPETVAEAGNETPAEQETAPGTAEMPAAETGPGNDTVGESAAEDENAREEAAGESGEEPGPAPGSTDENMSAPVSATAASAQIVESPLKLMKQEFQRRSQVIRNEMLNIQNSFVTIGFQLHWIHRNNMFRVLNYKSIYEYAEKECGIKRTTCCNLICIIENYAERDENGEVIESIADCYHNYSASQLVAMLGMPEELKGQVSPDMSVRAINRLKKGEPEPGTVAASPAPVEEPAPVREPEKEPDAEKEDENPAAEEAAVSDDTVHEEGQETGEMQEAESPGTAEVSAARLEESEDTETMETENHGDDAEGHTWEAANSEGDTLVEIDSYTDYQSMADELDLLMRTVFAEDASVRVKIVCVQG